MTASQLYSSKGGWGASSMLYIGRSLPCTTAIPCLAGPGGSDVALTAHQRGGAASQQINRDRCLPVSCHASQRWYNVRLRRAVS